MPIEEVKRVQARSGDTRSLIILLHGYGADGTDLISLAAAFAQKLPRTAFSAPSAPNKCAINPDGRQWFPLPPLDGSSQEETVQAFAVATQELSLFLEEEIDRYNLTPDTVALLGFSQGTMMALHIGPRRIKPLAAIVGFSGKLLAPEKLAEVVSKPPILLVHGSNDQMLASEETLDSAYKLESTGFSVETYIEEGVDHSIGPIGVGLAQEFLQQKLGING